MQPGFIYNYASIDVNTNKCIGVYSSPRKQRIDHFIQIPLYKNEYIGKYYYAAEGTNEKTWWERAWSELDENGQPVEGAAYVDTPWAPTV